MQKSYREFIGTPIRDRLTKSLLGRVVELVINPADGEILALSLKHDGSILLPTVDIARVTAEEVWVENSEKLAVADEIVRIAEVVKLHVPIYKNRVFTVSRQHLGEVIDFCFDTNHWILSKIEVAKKILHIPTEKKLISSSQIVRIKSSEITVRDAVIQAPVKAKTKTREIVEADLTPATFKTEE